MSRREHFDAGHGNPDHMLSKREQAEITGRALGGHIWDAMEEMMGGPGSFRQSVVTDAWSDAHAGWQGHDVRANPDDDDYPVFHHDMGNGYEARYPLGGPYIDIHPQGSDQALDALHVSSEDRNPEGVLRRIQDFDPEDYGL